VTGTAGVALIGDSLMGAAHSRAGRVPLRFFDLPGRSVMRGLCGRAVAALAAGKHVICEPLANSVHEAEQMTAAAADAPYASGVRGMVGFTYRRVAAIAPARRLVQERRVGEVRHVRAVPPGPDRRVAARAVVRRRAADPAGARGRGDQLRHPHLAGDPFMTRPMTPFTGQRADLSWEEVAPLAPDASTAAFDAAFSAGAAS